jgi:hypothetical protein
MAQEKQMSASQPLVFPLLWFYSQTRAFSALSSAYADCLLVDGAGKTNVCLRSRLFFLCAHSISAAPCPSLP